jgi:peptidyl-tRNA hydrolase, PTH1 family
MNLVVGLGNPGREYVGTRHNVGYDVVDQLAVRLGWVGSEDGYNRQARENFSGLAMLGSVSLPGGVNDRLLLLKPLTYMNLSGRSVQAAMSFYQMAPGDMMVALDDLALPCGRIRIRPGGSDGGHNGLRDIQRAIGSDKYPRLRLGIDPPPQFVPQKDYVLGRFSESQRPLMKSAVERAASAILCWLESGVELAMNRFNADPAETKGPPNER